MALARNHEAKQRIRVNVVIQRVVHARPLSQVSSFSGSQASSHSPLRRGASCCSCRASSGDLVQGSGHGWGGRLSGLSSRPASSGDSVCSMWTTVQCIHRAQTAVRRNRTKKVLDGKPDHAWRVGEQRRQEEAAEPTEHPDEPADGADVLGEVLGDVLEDRGLADAHRAAEEEDQRRRRATGRCSYGEDARSRVPSGCWRTMWPPGIDRNSGVDSITPKVQYIARRAPQRSESQPPTGRSSDAGKMNVAVSRAARLEADVEVVDVVLRQPRGEGDVGPEDGDVVEAEAPHPQLAAGDAAARAAAAPCRAPGPCRGARPGRAPRGRAAARRR